MPLPGITEPFRLHDAMHKNCGSDHVFRFNRSHGHDFFDFDNRGLRSHGHDGIEISRRQPVGKISQGISFLRFDQGEIRMNGHFQNAAAPFEEAFFLPLGYFRADTHRGIETLETSSGGAHAFAQNALRYEFQSHFLGGEALQKMIGVRTGKSGNHASDLIILEHDAKFAVASPAIVADGGDVLRAFARQCLNEVIRKARASESSDHDLRAIRNIRHSFVEAGEHFLLHHAPIASALRRCRKRPSTPLSRSHRPVSAPLKSFFSRPSRDGTMTKAGSSHSMASKSSISLACTSGTSRGIRSSPVTPRSSQIRDAASTESLSETCRSSRRSSQPFSSAMDIAG